MLLISYVPLTFPLEVMVTPSQGQHNPQILKAAKAMVVSFHHGDHWWPTIHDTHRARFVYGGKHGANASP